MEMLTSIPVITSITRMPVTFSENSLGFAKMLLYLFFASYRLSFERVFVPNVDDSLSSLLSRILNIFLCKNINITSGLLQNVQKNKIGHDKTSLFDIKKNINTQFQKRK